MALMFGVKVSSTPIRDMEQMKTHRTNSSYKELLFCVGFPPPCVWLAHPLALRASEKKEATTF